MQRSTRMAVMPRFVLLYHDCPPHYARPSHWDLMLECGETLRTWALEKLPRTWEAAHARTVESYPQCPALALGNDVAADELGNHRRDYLEYEGDLTDHRGRVIRVAAGTYTTIAESSTCWQVSLAGEGLEGKIRLSRSDAESTRWRLTTI